MNRRQLIHSGVAGLSVLGLSQVLMAQEVPALGVDAELSTETSISRNHGHELLITPASMVQLLRQLKDQVDVSLNIQGQSRHPHTVKLTKEQIVSVIVDGSIEVDSSEDFGHSHSVKIALVIGE